MPIPSFHIAGAPAPVSLAARLYCVDDGFPARWSNDDFLNVVL
ncbi:hypothetical protein [Musicola keenii]|nr:hypothetical protein [Musicola keenii]